MSAPDDEMTDTEMWRAFRQMQSAKRAHKKKDGRDALQAAGIAFTEHNGGAHLIIRHRGARIDFWPGTSRWRNAGPMPGDRTTHFGVQPLLRRLRTLDEAAQQTQGKGEATCSS